MSKRLAKTLVSIVSVAAVFLASACTTTGPVPEEMLPKNQRADLNTVNRINYDASKEYEEALQKFGEGCDGTKIIHDDETVGDRKIALVIQGTSERELVEEACELLDKYDYRAAFTFTGIDAAEDDETVKLVSDKGHEVIDNGLYGDLEMEDMGDSELIYDLTASRKIFTTLFDIPPGKLMLNSTYYTGDVCMAAGACGYEKIISPSPGSYLNSSSFKNLEKTKQYVAKLPPGKILVFKLKGYIDAVELASKVEAKQPAIDKMPGTANVQVKEQEENKSIKTLSWLLQALSEEKFKTVSLDRFKAMTEEEYVAYLLDETSDIEAEVYESVQTMDQLTGLSLCGLPSDEEEAGEIVNLLKENGAGATFFVTGKELEDKGEIADVLAKGGFSFATLGNTGKDLYGKDAYEDYEDLSLGVSSLQKNLSLRPRYYMPAGLIDDNLSKAAAALGLKLIKPRRPAKAVTGKISCLYSDGSDLTASLEKYLAEAKKADLQVVDITALLGAEDHVPEIDPEEIQELWEKNKGKLAKQDSFVYTSEKAMSIIFYGVSNRIVLEDVLGILKKNGYKCTFFLTFDELRSCRDQVTAILEEGHEIGLAYIDRGDKYLKNNRNEKEKQTSDGDKSDSNNKADKAAGNGNDKKADKTAGTVNDKKADKTAGTGHDDNAGENDNADATDITDTPFYDVVEYILSAKEYALWKYETDLDIVFQPYGDIRDVTKEAVSACGCTLAGYEYSLVQSKYVDAEDTKFFYNMSSKVDVHRGSIAYFNINYFTADQDLLEGTEETLCGQLLSKFISSKIKALTYKDVYGKLQSSTSYKVKTLSALLHSSQRYSVRRASGAVSDSNSVLGSMGDAAQQNAYMAARYVGNPDVTVIPGISESDMKNFDTTGKIKAGKVIFLTFDDWGNEKDINELLYVLDKYGVKGNFFVRTNNVNGNPNLLRAIAVSGHMIGSHSDTHFVGWHDSQDEEGNYHFESLTDEEAAAFRKDIVKSYATLSKYCGDVNVDGKPAVSTIYRPPTLAVSRASMYQLFDVGYSYIVSGNFSSHDYNAGSVDELVGELRNGMPHWYGMEKVSDGSVLVMHMSPNAQYTSEALDIMIPEWQAQGYTIARLDDYLR